jgi:hypothetical protein
LQVVPICNTQNEFAIRVDIKPNVAVMPEHHRRKSSWGRNVLAAGTAIYCDVQHRFSRDQ